MTKVTYSTEIGTLRTASVSGLTVPVQAGMIVTVEWSPDEPCPCDGTVGADAKALDPHGRLTDIKSDLRAAFASLHGRGRDYRGADLSTADLTSAWLRRVDLRCANLRMATLSKAHFLWADLRWVDFRGATLRNATFAASDLRHADLSNTDLRGVKFGVAQGSSGWVGCNLSGAKVDGSNLRGAQYHSEVIWPEGFDPQDAGATPL